MRGSPEALQWPLGVPRLDTAPNRALQAVLDELRRRRGAYMFLRVARRYAPPHRWSEPCTVHRFRMIKSSFTAVPCSHHAERLFQQQKQGMQHGWHDA